MLYSIIFFLFFLALLFRIFKFIKTQKQFHAQEEVESINEVEEYESEAQLYTEENEDEEDDTNGVVDPITRKKKEGGYQTKIYRGTDIEVAGFESKKDLAALKREELATIDAHELEEPEDMIEAKSEEPIITDEMLESGIGGDKARMQTMNIEVSQNYRVKGEVSGIANETNTVGRLEKMMENREKNKDKGGEISR